jgi:hypothetical protein
MASLHLKKALFCGLLFHSLWSLIAVVFWKSLSVCSQFSSFFCIDLEVIDWAAAP